MAPREARPRLEPHPFSSLTSGPTHRRVFDINVFKMSYSTVCGTRRRIRYRRAPPCVVLGRSHTSVFSTCLFLRCDSPLLIHLTHISSWSFPVLVYKLIDLFLTLICPISVYFLLLSVPRSLSLQVFPMHLSKKIT